MAIFLQKSFPLFIPLALLWLGSCYCAHLNVDWSRAVATWHGDANGPGNTVGLCNYQDAVWRPPYNKMVTAGGSNLYKFGQGCGACYQVKCTSNAACSTNPVVVTITDRCTDCTPNHFNLSGFAFGALAKPGQADVLRNAKVVEVEFERVQCNYGIVGIDIHVDEDSHLHYLAIVPGKVNGDGELASVEVKEGNSASWTAMEKAWLPNMSWGATWKLYSGLPLYGPFSVRLTSFQSRKTIVANDVIPKRWIPRATYKTNVNF